MRKLMAIMLMLVLNIELSAQDVKLIDGIYKKDGVAYTGSVDIKDEKGLLKSTVMVAEGKLQGDAVFYYPGGNVMESGTYVAGVKSGLWIRKSENGIKIGEGTYFNGQKHGKWYIWDEKGVKRFEMEYVNGQKANTWYNWDEKGELVATTNYEKM